MKYLDLLSKSKTVEILLGLQNKKMKFAEIAEITGNPTTATRRLKEMVVLGVVKREVQQDSSRTVMYELTNNGKSLTKVTSDLMDLK